MSQAQLLRADRQSFVRLSEMFTGSLKTTTTAGYPLDPHIEKLYTDVSVTYYMLPIPSSQSSSSSDKTDKKRQDAAPKVAAPPNKFLKGGAKGKAKERKGSRYPSSQGYAFKDSARRCHMLWIQFGYMQARVNLSEKACLCSPRMLQESSADRTSVTHC